jgi:pilus assembly protein CpaE
VSRILVVTDDTSLQRLLQLAIGEDRHEILIVSFGSDAFRRWSVERADLVILDANVAGVDAFELVVRMRASELPGEHTPLIMLGGGGPQLKVQGLRSGADDYLAMPIHPVELVARVRRLLARFARRPEGAVGHRGPGRAQVLALYGAKGGVGATTIAINLAIALHKVQRRRVVLVDADLQFGDHRVFLDLGTDKRSILDAVIAPAIDTELLRSVVVRHESGIDLLLAPTSPETAEHVSVEHHHMAQIVEVLRTIYDYVVVDLDMRLDDHALDVIAAAERLVVVMNADLSCIKNVRLVLETLAQLDVPNERIELLLNRSNAYTGITPRSLEAVLKRPIAYQVVNDYRAAITALNSGEPFMHARSDAPVSRSVVELARAIDRTPMEPRPSALGLLLPATVPS